MRSSPRCRSACAPCNATLPNIATAPVTVTARARTRALRLRKSVVAMYGTTLRNDAVRWSTAMTKRLQQDGQQRQHRDGQEDEARERERHRVGVEKAIAAP